MNEENINETLNEIIEDEPESIVVDEIKEASEVVEPEAEERKKKPKKNKNWFVKLVIAVFWIVVILLVALSGWILYSALVKDSVESHFEDKFIGYVNIPSASKFVDEMLYLSAIDAALAEPNLLPAQKVVSTLRSNNLLKTWWFNVLTNVRLDAAFYDLPQSDKFQIRAVADLGFRSAATRITPIILKVMPGILDGISEIKVEYDNQGQYFIYSLPTGEDIFIRFFKNLAIVEFMSDKAMFAKSTLKNDGKVERALKNNLKKTKKKTINLLADANILKNTVPKNNPVLSNLMSEIEFEGLSVINLELRDDNVVLNGEAEWQSTSKELQEILRMRGSVPKILKKLPASTEYLSLLNINTPEMLWKNLQPFLDDKSKNAYKTADKMSKLVLKENLEKIIFSWVGKELGVFGVENIKDPVFFVEVKDSKTCNMVFEQLFKGIFIDKDSSAVVDDIRISRIVFPNWVTGLLKIFKIELPRPFYFIEKDFIVFSNSSEAIAVYKTSKGKLTKNKKWKSAMRNFSPETSMFMYYNLKRSIPFFLQNQKVLYSTLQKYGQGLFSLKFDSNDKIKIDFFAIKTEEKPLKSISSFPKNLPEKVDRNIYCVQTKSGTPLAFWTHKENIFVMNLASGNTQKLSTDADTKLTLEIKDEKLETVWGLTKTGTVYKMNSDLTSENGFPIITSEKVVGMPVITEEGIVFSSAEAPKLTFVSKSGEVKQSFEMHAKMKTAPVYFGNRILALPRSFESVVYSFNNQGEFDEDVSNIELDGISAVQPVIFQNEKKEDLIANITEDGTFTLHYLKDDISENRQIIMNILDSACKIQPVYSKSLNSIFLISENNLLKRLDERGNVINAVKLSTSKANNYAITVYDITGDGIDEIFISGGGNAIYAYNSSLEIMKGFPITGAGIPYFLDVTGDGVEDIITYGIDNKIYAFSGGRK